MIAIPAKLCSDYILIPGTAIHIALEHTIHIAGIPTNRTTDPGSRKERPRLARVFSASSSSENNENTIL